MRPSAFDKRLFAQDIAGSRAHARMLVAAGILVIRRWGRMPISGRSRTRFRAEDREREFRFLAALEAHPHENIEVPAAGA